MHSTVKKQSRTFWASEFVELWEVNRVMNSWISADWQAVFANSARFYNRFARKNNLPLRNFK